MQPEVAITSAQTRLSEAQYDYKIAKVMLAYSAEDGTSWRLIPRCVSAERDTRDRRDERDEMGIQSIHVVPFAHVLRFTRHAPWL